MALSPSTTRIFARRLATRAPHLVSPLQVVSASIASAFTYTLAWFRRWLGCDHGSALRARVFVFLVAPGDRAFAGLVAAAPLLSFADMVAALVLRRIAFGVRSCAFALIAGSFVNDMFAAPENRVKPHSYKKPTTEGRRVREPRKERKLR